MEAVKGQIVSSRRGRDVTHWYVVVGEKGAGSARRLLVCDGKKRTLAAPKPKNPLHLQPTKTVLDGGKLQDDQNLRAALKAYVDSLVRPKQGG